MRAASLSCAILLVSCGSRATTSPIETTPAPTPATTTTYANPEVHGHPVAQCVTGEGWGAGARGRCGDESQKIIANEFCKTRDGDAFAVDWSVGKGLRGRHALWRYTRGAPPEKGVWSHGLATDRFTEIRCGFPQFDETQ